MVKISEGTLVEINLESEEKSGAANKGRSNRASRKLEIRKSSLADFTPISRVKMAATTLCDEEGNLEISCRGGNSRGGGKVVGESSETESTQERGEEAPPLKGAGRKTRKAGSTAEKENAPDTQPLVPKVEEEVEKVSVSIPRPAAVRRGRKAKVAAGEVRSASSAKIETKSPEQS